MSYKFNVCIYDSVSCFSLYRIVSCTLFLSLRQQHTILPRKTENDDALHNTNANLLNRQANKCAFNSPSHALCAVCLRFNTQTHRQTANIYTQHSLQSKWIRARKYTLTHAFRKLYMRIKKCIESSLI